MMVERVEVMCDKAPLMAYSWVRKVGLVGRMIGPMVVTLCCSAMMCERMGSR